MQRLHINDLAGHVLATEPEDWDLCVVPALENNQSYWDEKYTVEDLQKISKLNAPKFAAQYQQKPIVAGGTVIKTEWFKYYTSTANLEFRKIFLTADTAQKEAEHNDYSVLCAWGVVGGDLYLLDLIRDKWDAPKLLANSLAFWNKWRMGQNSKRCTAFYVEDKSSGTGLMQQIKKIGGIPIIGIPRTKDKLTRVDDVLTYIEGGHVYLPFAPTYSFNPAFLSECEGFSRDMTHPFDDQVDNLVDGIEKGIANRKVSILDVI
jgi:predicted phage terminase large subunit-like protein